MAVEFLPHLSEMVAEFLWHWSEMVVEFLWHQSEMVAEFLRSQSEMVAEFPRHLSEIVAEFLWQWSEMAAEFLGPLRDGGRISAAPVTFQLLWGIYFKRIGQLANNYCTVFHIASFVLFFSELAKCPQEAMNFFKFITYAVKTGNETLSKPILENHKIVWKVLPEM